MKKQIISHFKNEFSVTLTKNNIIDYWDVVYQYCMEKFGETSSETEKMIDNLF